MIKSPAVIVLCAILGLAGTMPQPKTYPYLVHVPGWPMPRHYHPELDIRPPEDFFGSALPLIAWRELRLTPEEIARKREAMLEHRSQMCVSAFYLLSFVRQNEIYGDFPFVDLERQAPPPDAGPVFVADTEWVGYAAVDDSLWVRIRVPEALQRKPEIVYFFAGLRSDTPFAKMPNILVRVSEGRLHKIFNASDNRYIPNESASFAIDKEYYLLKMPLALLGNPEGLLFGFETEPDYMPDGCTAFRAIRIEQDGSSPHGPHGY
jgi:hypothetical protein